MRIFLSAVLLSFAVIASAADIVHMRSGESVEGHVVALNEQRLSIRTGRGIVNILRVDVARIELTQVAAEITNSAPLTLATGTDIHVRLIETLSVRQSRSGDAFEAVLLAPLTSGNTTLAPQGEHVVGRVVRADRANGRGNEDKLHVELSELPLMGKQTQIKTTLALRPTQTGLSSLARWDPVRLEAGTELRFQLSQPVVLRPSRY
jgi:hypothetical protein